MADNRVRTIERIASLFKTRSATSQVTYGRVISLAKDNRTLKAQVDGSPSGHLTTLSRACNPEVGDRVLIIKDSTLWCAVAVIGGEKPPSVLESAYPVGSIYLNANVATNPKTLLGFGTWESFGQGRTVIGMGSNGTTSYTTLRATGGADTVTLTIAQLPPHNHAITPALKNEGSGSVQNRFSWASTGTDTLTTTNTGGGTSHENRMPYITVYMWRRTA